MNELSLFSGAGGGLLGTKLLGFTAIGYVEFNDYCQRVLRQRIDDGILDDAPIIDDVRCLDKSCIDKLVNLCYYSNKIIMEEYDMGAKRKDYDHAVELYNQGLSIADVAKFYNITRQAMHSILKRRDVSFRTNKRYGSENHFYRGGIIADTKAHDIFERALEKGIIERKTHCEKCNDTGTFKDGRSKVQAHHDDYNYPLRVKWLCQKCHHKWHVNNKAIPKTEENQVEPSAVIDVITAGFPD